MSDKHKKNLPKWLNSYYEVVGAFTVTIAILLCLLYGVSAIYDILKEPVDRNSYDFVTVSSPEILKMKQSLKNRTTSDSIILETYKQGVNLNDSVKVINATIKKISFENVYTENRIKIFASIISIIIAVVGFFGFKSLNDIREHSIKEAKADASKTARENSKEIARAVSKETTRGILTNDFVSQMFDESFKKSKDIYEKQIAEISEQNARLEKRILQLENMGGVSYEKKDKGNDNGPESDFTLPETPDE